MNTDSSGLGIKLIVDFTYIPMPPRDLSVLFLVKYSRG